jgi:pimeloyl-ACP methyl ester carboxylesterase
MSTSPAVVLVHGAFADASSWASVITRLIGARVSAEAVPNPLRSLTGDGEYLANILGQIEGPVVLVGQQYGGAVSVHASSRATNVRALVLVASYGLEKGESIAGSAAAFPHVALKDHLKRRTFSTGDRTGAELYIEPEHFHHVFAADLPEERAAVMAVSQRPATETAFAEPLAVEPRWGTIPCWCVVAGADRCIHPDAERAAARRMGARVTEIANGSHAIALSRPDAVAEVILEAVAAVKRGV